MKTPKVIDLFELEKLVAKKLTEETGRIHAPEFPIELAPAYRSYCRKAPTAWTAQQQKRLAQLDQLELLHTTVIDFYQKFDSPEHWF